MLELGITSSLHSYIALIFLWKMRTLASCLIAFAFMTLCTNAQERIQDVIYAKHDGVALTMDVYQPEHPNGAGIISIISGGWKSDHLHINDGGWAKAGYTTFVVVHGSQPHFHIDEIVGDLNRAVRFIRANASKYGVDPQKIGVTGSSAGGHLSLMLATKGGAGNPHSDDRVERESSAVNAVACVHPPTDFLNYRSDGDHAVGVGRLSDYSGAFGEKSKSPVGREQLGKVLSPIYWIHQEQPPVFIVHGSADDLVPLSQSERFYEKCKETGAICELWVRKGVGHLGWKEMNEDHERMRQWFDFHLLGKPPSEPFTNDRSEHPGTPREVK